MRNFILLSGITVGILRLVMPAHAALEDPAAFFALSELTSIGIAASEQMSDEQLAAVEGGAGCPVCGVSPASLGSPSVKVDSANANDASSSTNSQTSAQQTNVAQVNQVNQSTPSTNTNSQSSAQQTNVAQVNQSTPGGSSTNSTQTSSTTQAGSTGNQASRIITLRVVTNEGGTVVELTQEGKSVIVDMRGVSVQTLMNSRPIQALVSADPKVTQTFSQLTGPILGSPAAVLQGHR
jgi:hypothetical protein